MLVATISVHEMRDTVVVDIPGAFMRAENDELIYLKLEGKLAELLAKIESRMFRKYLIN